MKNQISKNLKEIRLSKGLTQKDLADKISVSRTAYNKYETGYSDLPISKLQALIKKLNLSQEEILKLLDTENLSPTEMAYKNSFEKIIGYYKTALRFAFNQTYSEYLVATDMYVPFDDLEEFDKQAILKENNGVISEEDYIHKYAPMYMQFSEESLYFAFKQTLQDNPMCIILFQFRLFENEHKEYWEKYKTEYDLPYEFFSEEGMKDWQDNFIKTIESTDQGFSFSFTVNWKQRFPSLFKTT